MKKDTIILIIAFLVVFGFGAYFMLATPASQTGYRPVDVGGGSISVENQPDDLQSVTLDAELAEPGWITIHESMSGAPADIIGTSEYLEAGVHEDLMISLDQPMSSGFRYIALLHVDDGDRTFVVLDDLPVMVNGEVVRPDFLAGREPGDDSTIIDVPGTDETIEIDE